MVMKEGKMRRCKCYCDEENHKLKEGKLVCQNHNAFKCSEFEEDNFCVCNHYATSHDTLGRCHYYVTEENICFCNDFQITSK